MSEALTLAKVRQETLATDGTQPCVGRVVRITPEGRALVDFDGNALGPLVARSAIQLYSESELAELRRSSVLLVFEDGDPTRPVVAGIVRDAVIGRRIRRIEADEEVSLKCGKSSIELHKDGKVRVRGTNLVSRASGPNKIRGATVEIN